MPLYPPATGGAAPTDISSYDRGFVGWAYQPYDAGAHDGPVAGSGQLAFALVKATKTTTISDIWAWFANAGAALVADENYLGIYSFTGDGILPTTMTLLGATPAGLMDTVPGAGQPRAYALAAPVAVTEGELYYVALLFNAGGARPSIQYLADPTYGYPIPIATAMNSNASAFTALPASLGTADLTASGQYFWAAIV